jgi:hypothetical protein
MRPINLSEGWGYFLGFFDASDCVVVFLSDNESDVEGLLGPAGVGRTVMRRADWFYEHGVIEKW